MTMFSITLLIMVFAVIINRVVDPFLLFGSSYIKMDEFKRPKVLSQERLMKAFAVKILKPNVVFLGTSRCAFSIDPNHIYLRRKNTYNLCVDGASIYETFRYLQHASFFNKNLEALLFLDFLMFNENDSPVSTGFKENYFAVDSNGQEQKMLSPYQFLISLETLKASFQTLLSQTSGNSHNLNGMRNQSFIEKQIYNNKGPKFFSPRVERNYYQKYYNNFSTSSEGRSSLAVFEQLLEFCEKNNIKLTIIIPPTHARLLEVINEKKIWTNFENWKKNMLQITNRVFEKKSQEKFSIWDFSGYSKFTTESVSLLQSEKSQLRWFWESSHFKKNVGDLILSKVLNKEINSEFDTADFGIRIYSENIHSHLEHIRASGLAWKTSFQNDASDVQTLGNN